MTTDKKQPKTKEFPGIEISIIIAFIISLVMLASVNVDPDAESKFKGAYILGVAAAFIAGITVQQDPVTPKRKKLARR